MPPEAAHEPGVRIRLSPLGWFAAIAGSALLLAMVGLLVVQVVILRDSQSHIQAQDQKLARLQDQVDAARRDAGPAIDQVEPLLRGARRLLTPAGESLEQIGGVAADVPRIAMGADLLLGEAIPLVRALNASDAPGAVAATHRLVDALAATDRLVRTVDSAGAALSELHRTGLIGRSSRAIPRFEDLIADLRRIQKETLLVQRRSVRIQLRQLSTQRRTLSVQVEALERIRSIDRKTGPTPPATPVTPAAPAP
jgi:hypothetical protein